VACAALGGLALGIGLRRRLRGSPGLLVLAAGRDLRADLQSSPLDRPVGDPGGRPGPDRGRVDDVDPLGQACW
jgi:hypothetical protein